MLQILFTVDYEIHGNGDGCPRALMVEPTERLLEALEAQGARLTIMADVAEILRFRQHRDEHGHDTFHYGAIAAQLQRAVAAGHDVQLHLHPSWFHAVATANGWRQAWNDYDFARLAPQRMRAMIGAGKQYLEALLRPVDPDYRCIAFRAANWSMQPSREVVGALLAHGIRIDTSVFAHGRRSGRVRFDYAHAPSALVPWPVDAADICRRDEAGRLWEVPIYCEQRWLGAFLSPGRLARAFDGRRHRLGGPPAPLPASGPAGGTPTRLGSAPRWARALTARHAWKADFNQCTGHQLVAALERAARRYDRPGDVPLPFNLIGHSKLFSRANQRLLAPFPAYAARQPDRFCFSTLRRLAPALLREEMPA